MYVLGGWTLGPAVACLLQAAHVVAGVAAPSDQPFASLGCTFDYIVVGSGPGGLTVANRLSEDPKVTVALIEAGQYYEVVTGNESQVPAYDYHFDYKSPSYKVPYVDWGFITTPQAGANNQNVHYMRGKTLGGSSALNYMAYGQSSKGAFQMWADTVGDQNYTYSKLRPYYQKSMHFTPPDAATRFANATPSYNQADVATGGPLSVGYANYAQSWTTWVAKGLQAIGIQHRPANLDGTLIGSSFQMSTINHTSGFRSSSEEAFLRPYLNRRNLAVFNGTLAEKIIFDAQKVATGLSVTTNNHTYTLKANKEVIVSGGVFQSPQLLLVSGVGPAATLKAQNIPVVHDLPGVGQGMNDHIFFGIGYRVNLVTSSALSHGNNLQIAINEFNTNLTGPLTSPGGDYVAYEKVPQQLRGNWSSATKQALSTFPADWPELQYIVIPNYIGDLIGPEGAPTDNYNYASLVSVMVCPKSRGNVTISSSRMSDPPVINPNWLTAQSDVDVAIAGFRRVRQAFAKIPEITIGPEYSPGPSVQTDDQIHAFLKKGFNTMYHASATNQMGKSSNPMAVVDNHARVFGVKGVRVVDISTFPFLPPGAAPQSHVYMLAEKIADDIKNGQ